VIIAVLLPAGGPRSGYAQVPRLLNDQATVTEGAFPLEQNVTINVAFFADSTSGAPISGWTESGEPYLGLIAEEVGTVVPEVVTYASNGMDAETVDYAHLVALLVEAIKEQQVRMAADRVRLQEMEARLEAVEARRSVP